MRGVRAIEKEYADEKQKNQAEAGEDDLRLAQAAILELHQREHPGDAQSETEKLANEETAAASALLVQVCPRGAEYHQSAGEANGDGYAEELAIGLKRARHFFS